MFEVLLGELDSLLALQRLNAAGAFLQGQSVVMAKDKTSANRIIDQLERNTRG